MQHHKNLYLATNLEALHRIAVNSNRQTLRSKKPTTLLNVAKKLSTTIHHDPLDEEMTYILLYRFIIVYEHLQSVHNDKHFVNSMLGKEYRNAKVQVTELRNNLINRYEEAQMKKIPCISEPIIPLPIEEHPNIFNGLYITCSELYCAFLERHVDILVMDARNEKDFAESHIKDIPCINIPDSCIKSGLSAYKLGLSLPEDCKQLWDKRATFAVTVLIDWNTTNTNYSASKLEKLRTILVDWDIGVVYKEGPVILNGGYKEWLDIYPMFCTSPTVSLKKANMELDDLLDLDDIEYPADSEHIQHSYNLEPPKSDDETISPLQLLIKQKSLIEQSINIMKRLIEYEHICKDLTHQGLEMGENTPEMVELNKKVKIAEKNMMDLSNKTKTLFNEISDLSTEFNIKLSFRSGGEAKEHSEILNAIDQFLKEYYALCRTRNEVAQERQNILLDVARRRKPRDTSIPIVNRDTKPQTAPVCIMDYVINGKMQPVRDGLTGLVNIRNTCYMNTIIQCLRHVPIVMRYFFKGLPSRSNITREIVRLVRNLWSNSYSVINPIDFYDVFTSRFPAYRQGHHEDAMEFFLSLFNYLNSESALDVTSQSCWSERELAWFQQHNGKMSFFTEMFYHQVRVNSICEPCDTSSLKFEIENSFYVSVPADSDFTLEDRFAYSFIGEDRFYCKTCGTEKSIRKSFSYVPPIMIIVLKRYCKDDNTGVIVKNKKRCTFPLKDFKVGNVRFTLYSLVLHSGDTEGGHYRAVCHNIHSKQWVLFNDEEVRSIDINTDEIKRQVYAFFYATENNNRANRYIDDINSSCYHSKN